MHEIERRKLERQFGLAFGLTKNPSWKSERGCDLWIDTEILQDYLAGPISQIVKTGGCAYVYERDDAYFEGVGDPKGLKTRLLGWHNELVKEIEGFQPTTSAESEDAGRMHQLASDMWAVAETACEIEFRRWEKFELSESHRP